MVELTTDVGPFLIKNLPLFITGWVVGFGLVAFSIFWLIRRWYKEKKLLEYYKKRYEESINGKSL